MNINGKEWIDKYNPPNLKSVILPEPYRKFFQSGADKGVVHNMIIESASPGTGKSTIMKTLAKEMNLDSLFINASDEGGKAKLQDISAFAKTASMFGDSDKMKVVMLDEADGLSPQMQLALRGAMDEFKGNCRFWLTCNDKNKIIKPIRESRLKHFSFAMNDSEFKASVLPQITERVVGILGREKVTFDKEALDKFIDFKYPDIRGTYNTLEQYSEMYDHIDSRIISFVEVDDALLEKILSKDILAVRRFVVEKGFDYDYLYSYMFNRLVPKIKEPKNRAMAISIIRNGIVDSINVPDKEIIFTDTLVQLVGMY